MSRAPRPSRHSRQPRRSRHSPAPARPGLRNVATAAAAASGVLAVVTPLAGGPAGPVAPAAETTGAFRLSGMDTGVPAARAGPVLTGADDLVRASGLLDATERAGRAVVAERERLDRAAEPAPAPTGVPAGGDCDLDTGGLGAVKGWVRDAAEFLGCAFGEPDLLGVGSRGNASDHPSGRALDLMTSDRARGDAIAECALANADELGVTYVIWRQRMNTGDGWEPMEDRGGDTANHRDHVHVSFAAGPGRGTPDLGRCA